MQTALIVLIVFGVIVIVWLSVLTYFVVRYARRFKSHVNTGIRQFYQQSLTERFTYLLEIVTAEMGRKLALLHNKMYPDEEPQNIEWVSKNYCAFWEDRCEELRQKREEWKKRGIL